jgi:hypothetical protein
MKIKIKKNIKENIDEAMNEALHSLEDRIATVVLHFVKIEPNTWKYTAKEDFKLMADGELRDVARKYYPDFQQEHFRLIYKIVNKVLSQE